MLVFKCHMDRSPKHTNTGISSVKTASTSTSMHQMYVLPQRQGIFCFPIVYQIFNSVGINLY